MNENKLLRAMQEWAGVFGRRTIHDFMAFAHEYGISLAQISVLMRLYYRGPSSILEIRQELYGSRAAATQMVDKLVQLGLIERSEDEDDRRVKQIILTEQGRVTVERGIAARRQWMAELVEAFDADEQKVLAFALAELSRTAKEQEERGEEALPHVLNN
jgi:MarR family transcriptional regulator, organic hydroperoxide resistance regulator